MIKDDLIFEIIGLRMLKKKGFGEKSLFDMLLDFKENEESSFVAFIKNNKEKYNFTDNDINSTLRNIDEARRLVNLFSKLGISVITVCDENYPKALLDLRALPVLFYRGDITLIDKKNVAIVGTRVPTVYGVEITERLTKILAGHTNVVSGGAIGIDTVAHQSALKNGGKTVVILGTSIDKPYPSINLKLFEKIVSEGGLILSPFGPFDEINEYSFVRRNQYIAEISQAVIVVEGGEKSGARLTAEYAFRRKIPVFAVPGPITSEKSYCPNFLISQGAKILYSEKVIYNLIGIINSNDDETMEHKQSGVDISDEENMILDIIGNNKEIHIDEILVRSSKQPGELSELLLNMEIKGIIEQLPGKMYRKRSY